MGGFCCRTLMKVFAILLCLFAALSFDLGDWSDAITVNASSNACFTAAYDSDDSDEDYFVLAVRPGDDGVNPTYATVSSSIKVNGTAAAVANLCSQVQASQAEDDMDYNCGALANTTVVGSAGNVTIRVVNTNANNATTVEIYAGFADGDACAASLVSSGGSWWWIVIVLIVIVVIIVIVAAVGGFLYMKKKKSSYQLYEDA